MKHIKGKVILGFMGVAAVSIGIIVACSLCTPMTLCLTFDDGLEAHATVAGPTLERYGWRGAFNIVTGLLEHPDAIGHIPRRMNWRQVKGLLSNGHEVYPHSLFPDPNRITSIHYNLRALAESGNIREVERQVAGSKEMIVEKLGFSPKFFCLPFNSMNGEVRDIICKYGMAPMNCVRRNFPTHPGQTPMSIEEYVRSEWRNGSAHIDIMMHGIIRSEGGWEPFEDAEHFDCFCKELKSCEESGIVKVVGYAESHANDGWCHQIVVYARKAIFKGLAFVGLI